ncbi:C-C motif chemokine 5 precursor [Gallus gallus]|nr:C-C motif chemokine 5 precursor [Gallus gallus]AAK84432.1 chemokine ah294 [Gallus gallus]AAX83393.1 chemokine ah294 [Gallus gallus]|eukprot:NP_001039297.1 C-C motif chemokine 5 precursor [Gallus gallus]
MMTAVAVSLSILLVAALFPQASSSPFGADTTVCCFNYSVRKLPQNHVKDYFYTSSKCPQAAVVFITRKGRQVCANPDARWVKEYINFLELQ